jgi:molybdopterin/thiamine biosynthesis adenylyltransferase/rhodanese-related sulfurtransferase
MPLSPAETARYSRHLLLPDVGVEGQTRLAGSSVLCVGAGGLGSSTLLYLAAAGVGRIGVVDADVVDVSNLQRQVLHGTRDVGRRKVDSAKDRLADLNPHVQVDAYPVALSAENALALLQPYDVIVDGTDNFPTRFLVDDACALLGKPNVYGSVFRFEGQASVFNYRGGPRYRDLYPEPPPPGSVPSCGEAGVLGVLPGLIGMIQATEAIKVLLGRDDTLSGRLLLYDALAMQFQELALSRDPNRPEVTTLGAPADGCGLPLPAARLDAPALRARLAAGWRPFLLDVRRPDEAATQIPGTDALCPHEQVDDLDLPADRDVVVYCRSGARSELAIRRLAARGFTRLTQLDGGMLGWLATEA